MSFFARTGLALILVLSSTMKLCAADRSVEPVMVGNVRQLFVDDDVIGQQMGIELVMHQPVPRETDVVADRPWEGPAMIYVSVFKDGERYRMYYRATPPTATVRSELKPAPGVPPIHNWTYTALAESTDGITWTKPKLGAVEFGGSKDNNLVWPTDANKPWRDRNYPGTDIFPFKDPNPNVPESQRYKSLANVGEYEQGALVSPDGVHWNLLQAKPVISYIEPDPMMDPPSFSFWDPNRKQYVAYLRTWINYRIRGFRRVTSDDYIHWSKPEVITYGDADVEHLYASMPILYDRSPGFYLMFAKRFVPWRNVDPKRGLGLSEIVFLSSRDGVRFDRRFMEPFLAPGLDADNWHARGVMMARGLLQLSPTELSLYFLEHYQTPTVRIRRATIRPDGFVSVHAPWGGGEFTTKPLRFTGEELEINYATSVAGAVRVEIQDEKGRPVPGYRLEDSDEIFGDELDRTVAWRKGHSDVLTEDRKEVSYRPSNLGRALNGKTIRLRFVMKAAHLYSFRFK